MSALDYPVSGSISKSKVSLDEVPDLTNTNAPVIHFCDSGYILTNFTWKHVVYDDKAVAQNMKRSRADFSKEKKRIVEENAVIP